MSPTIAKKVKVQKSCNSSKICPFTTQYDQLQMVTINPTKFEQNPSRSVQETASKSVTGHTDRHEYFYIPFRVAMWDKKGFGFNSTGLTVFITQEPKWCSSTLNYFSKKSYAGAK